MNDHRYTALKRRVEDDEDLVYDRWRDHVLRIEHLSGPAAVATPVDDTETEVSLSVYGAAGLTSDRFKLLSRTAPEDRALVARAQH